MQKYLMRTFKKLDIANFNQIQKHLNEFVSTLNLNKDGVHSHIDGINIHEQVSKNIPLLTALVRIGLIKYWTYTVIIVASRDLPAHRDEGLIDTLLLPLKNTEGSLTTFYSTDEVPELRYQDNGIPYYHYEKKQFHPICSVEVDAPMLMNVSVPHSITVGPNTPRVTLSLRFKDEANEIMERLYG